ncbi:MAG: ParA family protein, partial [Actinomycetota bacterium]
MDAPRGPRIIAVSNIKGGVAKTTSTVNLGACFAEMGYRTLVIDFDPQGNATEALGVDPREVQKTIYDVLVDDQETPVEDAIEATAVKNLFVVPANLNLAGAELELASVIGREKRLKMALDTVADQWDFILIDCQPSVGLLAVNAMTAADEILTPVQTEYQALLGVKNLSNTLRLIRKSVNPDLRGPTYLLTMYQRR